MILSWRTYKAMKAIRVVSSGKVWTKGCVVRVQAWADVDGVPTCMGVEDGWQWWHAGSMLEMGLTKLRENLKNNTYQALDKHGNVLSLEDMEKPNETDI